MKNKVEGAQNVEVSKKLPCEKPLIEQLKIMEEYTKTHRDHINSDKSTRELACLRVLYPRMFRKVVDNDLIVGRLDFLPIGFGSVTSLGGVGHYCVFNKLNDFGKLIGDKYDNRIKALYDYWLNNDTKAIYCERYLKEDIVGRFIDCNYPLMATARLSGMMLHYDYLIELGIDGIIEKIKKQNLNEFIDNSLQAMYLFKDVVVKLIDDLNDDILVCDNEVRKDELVFMKNDLIYLLDHKPQTFHQALQLIWLYALVAGCINYGRLDDLLGPFLVNDLNSGTISYDQAYDYVKSLWKLIENRRTTVNGRIIVGGYGRKHVDQADEFARLCLKVAKDVKYVEPQFTLRFNKETPKDIKDLALECLQAGSTYPTLYNDDVNVDGVSYG
ncbi:MAG: pyruvate formate lyase family protein, partial [Erysipelotrichaceae bacterium]